MGTSDSVASPKHVRPASDYQAGFGLIALIGVLAVLTIGLALASPAFIRIGDQRHQDREDQQLRRIADGIQTYLDQNKAFSPSLSSLAPDYVPFSSTQLSTNTRGFPRYYAVHPTMAGFNNRIGLTAAELVDTRFLLITNLTQDAAPVIATPADFEGWWTMDETLTPGLKIHRGNVGNFFLLFTVQALGAGGSYSIDGGATNSGGGTLATSSKYHLMGSILGFDEADPYDTSEIQFALTTNTSYWLQPLCPVTKQWNPVSPTCSGSPILVGGASINHLWTTINFSTPIPDPIVIVGVPTYNGTNPGAARIRNVSSNSFQLRFQEWAYLDTWHLIETIPHLALTRGRHVMGDGSIWEVGTFPVTGNNSWTTHNFTQAFPGTPTVLVTPQSFSDSEDPITVRVQSVSTSSFQAELQEEEALWNGTHGTETIGYLAVYSNPSTGTVSFNGPPISYNRLSMSLRHIFATIPGTSVKIKIEEEKSLDQETNHTFETVNVLILDGQIFAQDVTTAGPNTATLRQK